MLLLSQKDVKKALSPKDILNPIRNAYIEYSEGKSRVPVRTPVMIEENNGTALFMPAYSSSIANFGVKVVSVYPGNHPLPSIQSVIVLSDAANGVPISVMDGRYITALRTAGASAVATDLLALPDSGTLAVIGCGGMAFLQVSAIAEVRKIKRVNLFDVCRGRVDDLARKIETDLDDGMEVAGCQTPSEAVSTADIIVTVTTSSKPVFTADDLKRGAHINAVGAFKPDMQEIGADTILRAAKIFVDSLEAVLEESGDIIIPMREGFITGERITGEIGQLLQGAV